MTDDAPQKKGPGRPPTRQAGATVATWLPAPEYDQLYQLARAREESLSSCLRRIVRARLTPRR